MQGLMYEVNSDAAFAFLSLLRRLGFFGGESSPQEPNVDASTESQLNVATTETRLRGQNRTMKGVITLDCAWL
jgi:hypothetical protein